MWLMWLLVLVTAVQALAQQTQLTNPDPQTGAYRVGGGVTPPRLTFKREPTYSEEARIARLNGRVVLSIVVGADGTPQNLRVVRGLGLGLDESAVECVRTWRFSPGTKDGQPVNVMATIEVNFRLLPGPLEAATERWDLTGISFQVTQGAARPTVTKVAYPPYVEGQGTVTLSLDVDETGVPKNLQIEKASDERLGSALVDAVQNWRFNPAMQNGKPVTARCTLTFALRDPASAGAAAIPPVRVTDPAKAAAIEQLIALTAPDEVLRRTLMSHDVLAQQLEKALPPDMWKPENRDKIREDLREFQNRLIALMAEAMNPQKHKEQFVQLYDETFTTEEIQSMLAFYKTPAGEAMLKKMPELTERSVTLGTQLMAATMPEIQRQMKAWAEMMKQKYGQTPGDSTGKQ